MRLIDADNILDFIDNAIIEAEGREGDEKI